MSTEPRYPYVHVATSADDADATAALLFDLGATGVEERDETTYVKGPAGGGVLIVASFDEHDHAQAAVEELRARGLAPDLVEVVGDAWRDEWKKFYEPFALTPSVLIRPPWQEAEPAPGQHVLVLEPGRAFGTGLHATTSLVANFLHTHAALLAQGELLDAGCGSGILSLVALALGAPSVVGFDIDPEAVATARENAERNALQHRCRFYAGTIGDEPGRYPWVLANIESRILDPIAEELAARLAPGGHLLLSGILLGEEAWMRERFGALSRKLVVVGRAQLDTGGERAHDKDGWVALHLRAD